MRRLIPLFVIGATALVLATPAEARQRCDVPEGGGIRFKATISMGHRDADTQKMFDMMALRQNGINARDVRRTSDGCLEAWVPGGNGKFHNEYYDPDDLDDGVVLDLSLD